MKFLLVEDDEFKQNAIENEVYALDKGILFNIERSVRGAVENLKKNEYSLILLDMSLPSHNLIQGKGSPVPMPSGGMEVIMELGYMERTDKVIILTQFPEIEIDHTLFELAKAKAKITSEYQVQLLEIIRFNRESDSWKKLLIENIERNF